jgi:methyl-accepting chemotaxis protein
MLKNLTIKTRLVFVLSFLCLQLIVGAVLGIGNLARSNDAMKSMYEDRLVALGQLDQIVRLLNRNELAVAKAISDDPAEAAKVMDEVDEQIKSISKVWGEYMATYLTPDEKQMAERFAQRRSAYVTEALLPAIAAVRVRDTAAATTLLHGKMETMFTDVRKEINDLIQLQQTVAKQEFQERQDAYVFVRNSCIAALIAGLLMALAIGVWLVRAITKPLDEAIEIAGKIAAGNLDQDITVDSTNEMGRLKQALRNMNESLVKIVVQVRTGTDTIASASNQIATGNLDLSSRTEQQAASLEETASSMEELTSTVRQNADNARQADKLAQSASDVAGKGGAVVSEVVETMGSINESSRKIVDIISVIDGIAFQTNILALNAAVEAARAGEQGRGFAVVASEVRNLAQRSAGAAKEIKGLIGDSVEKVDAGSRLVEQAGVTMAEIVESIRRVTDIMGEITAATGEQAAGIEQINQAITQMDDVTQQNAALVEEAAAAAKALQDQAGGLSQLVSVFRVGAQYDVSMAAVAPSSGSRPAQRALRPAPARKLPKQAASGPAPKRLSAVAERASDDWEEF